MKLNISIFNSKFSQWIKDPISDHYNRKTLVQLKWKDFAEKSPVMHIKLNHMSRAIYKHHDSLFWYHRQETYQDIKF